MKPQCVTIEMKALVVMFIMLYKVVLTFKFVVELSECVTIQMKAIEQYFRVQLVLKNLFY